jgi:hypothetical protein
MDSRIRKVFILVACRRLAVNSGAANRVSVYKMQALRAWAFAASTGAPQAEPAVHSDVMSIEKESTGFPEVNVHKRTTKVNLGIVIGVAGFFAAMAGVIWWFWSRNP